MSDHNRDHEQMPETQFYQPGIDASGYDEVEEHYVTADDAEFYEGYEDFDDSDFDDSDFGEADYGDTGLEGRDEDADVDAEYTDEEWAEIERAYGIARPDMVEEALPTVAIVGRPNVGKSSLQRSEVPVILVANKFESESQWGDVAEFYGLGLGDPWPVSALHGRGGADVLDEILRVFPEVPRAANSITDGPRRVAIVGRPNVGKSSLLNKLSKSDRSVVDNASGTTVDPVDELIQLDKNLWKFIDTAGLRKKVKNAQGHEYYASLRTRGTIDAAEVCVVVIDASQEISEQDQRVISMVLEAGKAMVICFNKWDLMDEDRRYYFDREFEEQIGHLSWVTKINISADTGRGLHRLEDAMTEALENWDKRISTGHLNTWLREAIAANPPPMKNNRLPKLLFSTMAATRPPTIILFTTGFLDASYRRYLERKFRERFGYHGTPIRIAVRVRERNQKKR